MLIEGTVLDQSPAQPGTPCVSKDSMSTQMEYLHVQMPIGGLWGDEMITGVPVTLSAMDSDGGYVDIGTVTTEGYYGTFGLSWTLPEEGTYKIVASFEGDESYGSSGAATYVTVGPAPAPSVEPETDEPITEEPITDEPTEEPESEEPTTVITTEVAIILAVAIAAIIGIGAFWVFRRRK